MALSINELNAVSKKYFDPTLTQQVYEKSPFFAKLKADKKIKTDGGTSMQWTIRYQKLDNAKATGPRAKVDFQSKETRTAADIDWVFYDAQTLIHWDELVKNSGKGKIIVDKGGVKAIVDEKKSLLPVGIKDVVGDFKIGDNVAVLDEDGNEIARGLTNFSSDEIKKIMGKKTSLIPKILNSDTYFDEVIHRDNLVIKV